MTYFAQACGLRPFGPAVAALPRPALAAGKLVTWGSYALKAARCAATMTQATPRRGARPYLSERCSLCLRHRRGHSRRSSLSCS